MLIMGAVEQYLALIVSADCHELGPLCAVPGGISDAFCSDPSVERNNKSAIVHLIETISLRFCQINRKGSKMCTRVYKCVQVQVYKCVQEAPGQNLNNRSLNL